MNRYNTFTYQSFKPSNLGGLGRGSVFDLVSVLLVLRVYQIYSRCQHVKSLITVANAALKFVIDGKLLLIESTQNGLKISKYQ